VSFLFHSLSVWLEIYFLLIFFKEFPVAFKKLILFRGQQNFSFFLKNAYCLLAFFFDGTGVWTQDLTNARQVLYHLSHFASWAKSFFKGSDCNISAFPLSWQNQWYYLNICIIGEKPFIDRLQCITTEYNFFFFL
jgi:hypothetical protein